MTTRKELGEQMLELISTGDTDQALRLLKEDADVNVRDKYGKTVLFSAAEHGILTPMLLKTFIEHGADINDRTDDGSTALIWSAYYGHLTPELLKTFISHGANINAQNDESMTALIWSARSGCLTPKLLDTFISHGTDIHTRTRYGRTALIWSAGNGHLTPELLEVFVQHGADINMQTKYGWSALMMSAEKGYLTSELAHAYAEQFTKLGTPIEKINEQVDNDKSAVVLIAILLKKLETEPWLVVDFIKKHASRKLQEWVNNGVEGADILVSRLIPYFKKAECAPVSKEICGTIEF